MSFFRKKSNLEIPPVADARSELLGSSGGGNGRSTSPRPPSYRSSASTYNASRDGDPYEKPVAPRAPPPGGDPYSRGPAPDAQSSRPLPDRYARNNRNVGDPYARSGRNADADRGELFSGYNPEKNKPAGSSRFDDNNERDGFETQEQEDEDVEGIKQQTRFTKQESVNSTRNALRIAREAEETARGTLLKLGDQSGMYSLVRPPCEISHLPILAFSSM